MKGIRSIILGMLRVKTTAHPKPQTLESPYASKVIFAWAALVLDSLLTNNKLYLVPPICSLGFGV